MGLWEGENEGVDNKTRCLETCVRKWDSWVEIAIWAIKNIMEQLEIIKNE